MSQPVRILHLHSSFSLGGKEARAARLMNAWQDRAVHSIVSGVPDQLSAQDAIDQDVAVSFPQDAPLLTGRPALRRYLALARYMQQFDLVLSYNWGAMDGVMAHRLFSPFMRLPPLIHHEDGFNSDEANGLKSSRNNFRRMALGSAHAVVVPSAKLADIALRQWGQSTNKVRLIRNGIDVGRYGVRPKQGIISGLNRSQGKLLRSEEHTSELQSLMRISYAVFCLKKKINKIYEQ